MSNREIGARPFAGCTGNVASWCFSVVFTVATFALVFFNQAAIPDDAFIYLQVAENIAAAQGWSFNSGQVFNATTAPIQTILLAILSLLGWTGADALLVLYGLGLTTTGITLHFAFRRVNPISSVLAPALILLWPVILASIGLEISTMFALAALTALTYQKGGRLPVGILAGFVALTRPEGVILGPIVLLAEFARNKRVSLKIFLGWIVVLGGWLIYSWNTFGLIVPHTVTIKSMQPDIEWWRTQGPWILAFIQAVPQFVPTLVLAAFGCARAWRAHQTSQGFAAILLLFGAAQIAGYTILDAPAGYWWYFAPGGVALIVAASLGIDEIRTRFAGPSTDARQYLAGALSLMIAFLYLFTVALSSDRRLGEPYRLSLDYRETATWIEQNSTPGSWVAAAEIGYIGYFSKRYVRDMLGLLHREAIGPLSRHEWHWWLDTQPDFVVIHKPAWIGEPGSADYAWPVDAQVEFEQNYSKVYSTTGLDIYARVND